MNENIIKARGAHPFGLKWLARTDGPHADMLMDFGVYRMKKGDVWEETAPRAVGIRRSPFRMGREGALGKPEKLL